jgi:hypothetical protein
MLLERISVALALRLQNFRYTTNSCRFWQNEAKMINLFNGPPLMGQAEMRRPFTKKCMEPFWPDEPNLNTLVERRLGPAQAFDRQPALFRLEPALAGGGARLGRPARTRRHRHKRRHNQI